MTALATEVTGFRGYERPVDEVGTQYHRHVYRPVRKLTVNILWYRDFEKRGKTCAKSDVGTYDRTVVHAYVYASY